MKSLLILPHITVENANAISGLVYGFPAITHFLGYVHAISRELHKRLGVKLGGCGIICHNYQIHAHKNGKWGDYIFSLTRNSLTREGKVASFNEEGRIHVEVSLVIECDFTSADFDFETGITSDNIQKFTELVYQLSVVKHLAGGIITDMSHPKFYEIPQTKEKAQHLFSRVLCQMLPGVVLCDRSVILEQYLSKNPDLNPFDALLNFYTLQSKAILSLENMSDETKSAKWEQVSKPCKGWIVPIQFGYKAISPLYDGGMVDCVRNCEVPFRFVEPVYGLAEWIGLHRVYNNIESIIWRYQNENGYYVCLNEKLEDLL